MRILLVGEYSGFHNALKAGLTALGHEVTIVGDGDGFKQYPVDVHVGSDYYVRNPVRAKFKVGFQKLTGRNLEDGLRWSRFRESEHLLRDHDIVQFVNSNPFGCEPDVELRMLKYIVENNGRCVLAGVGDDTYYVDYLMNRHQGYSILDPVTADPKTKKEFYHSYKYVRDDYRFNFNWLMQNCMGLLPYIADFHMAAEGLDKVMPPLPLPVNLDALDRKPKQQNKLPHIFLGINRANYYKKGIPYFEEALRILESRQNGKFKVTIAENLPYREYMQAHADADILLDQCLTYGQGYNALEAMAQGKVVFCGDKNPALPDNVQIPVIDAVPDANKIAAQLLDLIVGPSEVVEMGDEAKNHLIKYHTSIITAERFLDQLNN